MESSTAGSFAFWRARALEAPKQTVQQGRTSLGVWLGEQELTDERLLHSNLGIRMGRSIARQTDDQRFSKERLIGITGTASKPTKAEIRMHQCIAAPTRHKGRLNDVVVLQAVQGVKDEEPTTPMRVANALTIEVAEAAEAARAASAPGFDFLPPPEAPAAGTQAAPVEGAGMMVDSNITESPSGDVSMEPTLEAPRRRISPTPAPATTHVSGAEFRVDHLAGDDKRTRMITGLVVCLCTLASTAILSHQHD